MELRQLKYFLAVADASSFAGAASSLFVSRQAVSKAVSLLEEELHTSLFTRETGGAFLTPAGLLFYDRARSSILALDTLKEDILHFGSRYLQRVRIVFTVGLLPPYETRLLNYKEQSGNIQIDYREVPSGDCSQLLLDHEADIAVCTVCPSNPLLSCHAVLKSRLGFLMRRSDLWDGDDVTLDDLSLIPVGCLEDGQTTALLRRHGITPQYSGYDFYRLVTLAQDGKCATVAPEVLCPSPPPDLFWTPLSGPEHLTVYCTCLRSQEESSLYHSVLDELELSLFNPDT